MNIAINKFNIWDKVCAKNVGVGRVTDIEKSINIMTNEIICRYRLIFDNLEEVWFDEDDLELYVEHPCEPLNGVLQDSSTRPCYYLNEKATFHRWVDETKMIVKFDRTIRIDKFKEIKQTYEEHGIIYPGMDAIPVITTFALIELKDGSMKKVPPEEIRFIMKR